MILLLVLIISVALQNTYLKGIHLTLFGGLPFNLNCPALCQVFQKVEKSHLYRSKEETTFQVHALQNHPKSKAFFNPISSWSEGGQVKTEENDIVEKTADQNGEHIAEIPVEVKIETSNGDHDIFHETGEEISNKDILNLMVKLQTNFKTSIVGSN